MIDRLLNSPHYGERWGRHWLDTAGYADSDGYTEADTPREYAYKYRDYVIRSFNADKPFDEFIVEQLAGDELAAEVYTNRTAAVGSPAALEKLVATGFLRMGPDGTATPGLDQDVARNQVMADAIKIVSTSLWALRGLRAMPRPPLRSDSTNGLLPAARGLEPAYDWKNWRTPAQRLISLYTDADRVKAAEVEAEAKTLVTEKDGKQKATGRSAGSTWRNSTPRCANPFAPPSKPLRTSARRRKRNCLWIIPA